MKISRVIAFLAFLTLGCGALAQSTPNTLGKIKAAKAINVAYSPDSLPFSYTDNGEAMGYTIDLCKRVIAQIGRAVGVPDLKVNWIPGSTPERLDMVARGRADLECANTTQTLGRLANVDFSSLVYLEAGGFIAKNGTSIARVADMGGKKIAVLKGTTTEARLREMLQKRLVNATVVTVDKPAEGIAMLESGAVDVYAGDRIKVLGQVLLSKDSTQFTMLSEDFSYEPYALALPRNDSALRLEVNRALSQLYLGGDIQRIYVQWLGKLGQPPDLLIAMYLLNAIPD